MNLNESLKIGALHLNNRLIQGPLAGYTCAPFRQLVYQFSAPAYTVSEMVSAHDVIYKHSEHSRYLYRAPEEKMLCYQLAGNQPELLAQAALKLEQLGADLIDLNCGCPKDKIRKKGFGSALLTQPEHIKQIIETIRQKIQIPLTVKIRIQNLEQDIQLSQTIEQAGADALIIHGRGWQDDYHMHCDFKRIKILKEQLNIPVIANGDIMDEISLKNAMQITQCDGYMISRAATGSPWLFKGLLQDHSPFSYDTQIELLMLHLNGLALLEDEYKALLQARTLVRYYFRPLRNKADFSLLYACENLITFEKKLKQLIPI